MKIRFTTFCLVLSALLCSCHRQINLSGEWKVSLHESEREAPCKPNWGLGPTQNIMYEPTKLNAEAKREGTITLPGTLDEYEYGNKVENSFIGCLSRKYQFIGEATYSRLFHTYKKADWILKLERVLWKSTVKIDGQEIGTCESLATPHCYLIKDLMGGEHTIEITVDNTMIYSIGEKSHAYGEHMQTIWNGILGEITLTEIDKNHVDVVKIHAPFPANEVAISFRPIVKDEKYLLSLADNNGKKVVEKIASLQDEGGIVTACIPLENIEIKPWDEFTPNLYTLTLKNASGKELYSKRVGFRSLKREGNKLFINGKSLFIRGNIDNCHFPLTGYPSMKKEDWRRIMKIQKENGANTIRFHSYCPPEAAFEAADELGLYLAPEAGVWIDWWMPKYTDPIGKNAQEDEWLHKELQDITKEYGSHASFTMMCIGNELGSCNFNLMADWIKEIKSLYGWNERDGYKNRLYTLSTARTLTDEDDYFVTHQYPNVGVVRHLMYPRTDWNYDSLYSQTKVPTIAHEIGQWPVYPDWTEIKKYKGLLEAKNLEELRKHAEANGVLKYDKDFHFASAMQNRMMYKDEMESFMRTPSCNGLDLLGMQDYSGQGEALIGWLDSFYEKKGCWTPQEVRGSFAPIVTLASFPKYGWENDEHFVAKLIVRNQKDDSNNVHIAYQITKSNGEIVAGNCTPTANIKCGELKDLGSVDLSLANMGNERLTLTTQLLDEYGNVLSEMNKWNFWTFEKQVAKNIPTNVVLTDDLDVALRALGEGKRVVVDASSMGNNTYQKGDWGCVYWSTTWFPGQQMQTLGVCIDKKHPIVKDFHCEGYSDWIWWKVFEGGRVFDLKGLDYKPIFMAVPDFHNNQLLGGIFELKVGKGKLLVSGYKLDGEHIEQVVFRNAVIDYVASKDFEPTVEVNERWLIDLLNTQGKSAKDLPEEFRSALFYVECGVRFEQQRAWSKLADNAYVAKGIDYDAVGFVVKNNRWVTNTSNEVNILIPAGEEGMLHLLFDKKGRKGCVEGHDFNTGDKYSISLPIDREDCLDGHLVLRLDAGANDVVGLKRIVFTKCN